MARPRLLVADDHRLVAEGICKLLDPEFEISETVYDGRAAVEAFQRLQPDVLLLDIGLPLLNGIEVARKIRRTFSSARIIFITMHSDRLYVEEAFAAGASGYVLKSAAPREMNDAIRDVLGGRYYVSPAISRHPGEAPFDPTREPSKLFGGRLTSRQREVLQLIAEGKTMKETAAVLKISVRTVEFHKNGIMQELGRRSTAELTRYALEHGIVAEERANFGSYS